VTGWQDDYGFLINQRPDRKNVVIALSPVGGRMAACWLRLMTPESWNANVFNEVIR
jgi:hypothetical protein